MKPFRKKEISLLKAIKLYGTSPPRDRDLLVESILNSMHETFGAFPAEFDIHGL